MSDHLIELEALAPQVAEALEGRKLSGSLGRASEKLADTPKQVARFKALVEVANALGANSDQNAKRVLLEAAEAADEIGEGLETASKAEDLQYVSEDFPKFGSALRTLDTVLRQLWRQTVISDFQSLVPVGELLARISKTADLGERLRDVGREAQNLVDRNVPADQLGADIIRLRQVRANLDTELHRLTDNEEVDTFLSAVTSDTATLAQVTPAVSQWLRNSGALEAFAVRGVG